MNLATLLVAAAAISEHGPTEIPFPLYDWGCEFQEGPRHPFTTCANDGPGQFEFPVAIGVAPDGSVWVADGVLLWLTPRLQKFSENGSLQLSIDLSGLPRAVEVDASGDVFLSSGSIKRYSSEGVLETAFPAPSAVDMAVSAGGEVFVLAMSGWDSFVHRFSRDGVPLAVWRLNAEGTFSFPTAIIVDSADRVHVLDNSHRRFRVFDREGTPSTPWMSFRGLNTNWAAEIDAEGRYLLGGSRISVVSSQGLLLASWDARAMDIALGPQGRIFTVDERAGRVRVYGSGIAIRTEPPGMQIEVDGVTHRSPAVFDWAPGSEHDVSVPTLLEQPGTRHTFASWNDGAPRSRHIVAPAGSFAFIADYATEFWVDVTAAPDITASPSQWAARGQPLTLEAVHADPRMLIRWEGEGYGSVSAPSPTITVVPQEPLHEHATFVRPATQYDLSISASATDPFVNTADPSGGSRALFLWVTCATGGVSAIEASVDGSLDPQSFTPASGVLNASDADRLMLAIGGCPTGETVNRLLGLWIVDETEAGTFCLQPSPKGVLGAVNCDPFATLFNDIGVRGYTSAGGAPCERGTSGCYFGGSGGEPQPVVAAPVAVASPPAALSSAPNPFGDQTSFRFSIPAASLVNLSVYDVTGRLVARLAERDLEPGTYSLPWNGLDTDGHATPAGMYFVRLEAGAHRETAKVLRIRP